MLRRVAYVVGVSATAFGAIVVEEAEDKAHHRLQVAHIEDDDACEKNGDCEEDDNYVRMTAEELAHSEEDGDDDEAKKGMSHDAMFQKLNFVESSGDQYEVLMQTRMRKKPAMVVVTKKTCPRCTELAESMLEDSQIQETMKKLSSFHMKDEAGNSWRGNSLKKDTYVPRTYFFNADGVQMDVHSPNKKYPYYFKNSASLLGAMQKVLA